MDPKEAKRIFTLINSPTSLLQDRIAVDAMLKYVNNHELGDSRFANQIEIYTMCAIYIKREEPITEDEFHELRRLGIPAKERQELNSSLGGDRSVIDRVLKQIQEGSLNKIVISNDLNDFKNYVYGLIGA